ncbi:hypothetical protein [Maribacter sp. 2307ULW6-5]|uniref:hypothetical protein n=1 Tax=Maribacter sp. 2307ULW6-5 TaxID=3386275 RepID=UPI0039BD4F98
MAYPIEAGVVGFLVPAMAAKVHKLEIYERLGMGSAGLIDHKELLRLYLALGFRNVLFRIPYENDAQFKAHFSELASTRPEMSMLQDWDASGVGLPDGLMCHLFATYAAFRCLKVETVPAGAKNSRLLALTEGSIHLS